MSTTTTAYTAVQVEYTGRKAWHLFISFKGRKAWYLFTSFIGRKASHLFLSSDGPQGLTSYNRRYPMRKNRFCTFTLISALVLAALPASLAAAGTSGTLTGADAASLPANQPVTLTITPGSADASYQSSGSAFTAYRVLAYTPVTGGGWTWSVVNGFTEPGNGTFDPDRLGSYSAQKLQSMADQLALQVDDDEMTDKLGPKTLTDGSCSWTTDQLGVYLVCETATAAGNFPSAPFLVSLPYTDPENENSWKYELTAAPKGSSLGLQKVISNAKGAYLNTVPHDRHMDTVANGDTVNYRISTRIPDYTEVFFQDGKNPTFRLVDTLAKGLTLNQESVRITSGGEENELTELQDYNMSVQPGTGGTTVLTIVMLRKYLSVESNQNKELVLTCSATVNDSVSLADAGNKNDVKLQYSYDPNDPDTTKETEDDADVYTFGIQVEKFDGDSTEAQKPKLGGAQFALFKETAENCTPEQALAGQPYRDVGETDENGLLDFKGLDAGTYYLKEVKAPDGYSLLMNPIKVEIIPDEATLSGTGTANTLSFTAKVNGTVVTAEGAAGQSRILDASGREETVVVSAANHHGFSLPSTGGRGILILLAISAAGLVTVTASFVKAGKRRNTFPADES